jgi:enoyl-CoA hydratase
LEKVLLKKEDSVAWLVLNRPERRNAIDDDVMDALSRHLSEVKDEPKIKCLVITGSGNQAFCSGGDLSVFHRLKTAQDAEKMLKKMGDILYDLFTFPKPTIALLNGTAVGGGCEIATACDFRIAFSHAAIGFIQGTLGITTGWGGATFLFERLPSQTALTLLSSAKRISAEEAKAYGFLHKVVTNREATQEEVKQIIHDLVPLSPEVLSAYKRRYLDSVNLILLKTRLEKEIHECSYLWEQEEHLHAVDHFLNK